MAETTRISVALTPEDHREVLTLARRCNTSASALGQLAIRHMLLRERDGTVPMLPEAPAPAERPHSEQLAERAAGGIAFWRSGEADTPALPDASGLFGTADFGRAEVLIPAPPPPEPPRKVRVSVGLTEDEAARINALSRRCNTSAAALGVLAFRHILLQAASGAIPMLPVPDESEPKPSMENYRKGLMTSFTAWQEEATVVLTECEARDYELQAIIELERLARITSPDPMISPEAD